MSAHPTTVIDLDPSRTSVLRRHARRTRSIRRPARVDPIPGWARPPDPVLSRATMTGPHSVIRVLRSDDDTTILVRGIVGATTAAALASHIADATVGGGRATVDLTAAQIDNPAALDMVLRHQPRLTVVRPAAASGFDVLGGEAA